MKRRKQEAVEIARMVVVGFLIALIYVSGWVSSSIYAQLFGEVIK